MTSEKKPPRVRPVLIAYGRTLLRYPAPLVLLASSVLGIELAGVIAPLYLKRFINALATGPHPEIVGAIIVTLGIYAGINFFAWFCQRIRMMVLGRIEALAMSELYDDAFTYLIGHSHDFFISNFTGTLTRRVTRYARAFENVLDNVAMNFVPAFIFIGGAVVVLSYNNIWIGLGLLLWTLIFIYIQYRMVMWMQPLRTARMEEDSRMTGVLSDAVLNHSTIAAFAAEKEERRIFSEETGRWYGAMRAAMDAYARIYAVQGLFAFAIEVGLLAGAAYLWLHGRLTVGDFVLIQVYIIGLMERVWGIGRNMRQLYDAFTEATEMLDIMELPHGIRDADGAKALPVTDGEITFDAVDFKYADGRAVLEDFTLAIEPKEKVAFVGASGAGKSTLAKLLLRLYDITGGAIRIDGEDIAKVTQESLRSSIALVPQEPVLFHRTLLENIRYGRPGATDEEVYEAARQAHCYEFITRYPEGFSTLVGERGVKLSGGERQRVAIARAILKNAPILILDEATSSLDSESEALIQDALSRLMEGKTVIAIAHRLSTVMKMDRIIVIEKGKVVQTGTHAELLAHESNLYKKLWEIQAGGFLSGVGEEEKR